MMDKATNQLLTMMSSSQITRIEGRRPMSMSIQFLSTMLTPLISRQMKNRKFSVVLSTEEKSENNCGKP